MPVAPATIVRTNRSWPGTSTTLSSRPDGSVEPREPELDRDAALALLRQAVGVDAGERLDQRGLAVIDVPGRPERERRVAHRSAERREHAAHDEVDLDLGDRARIEQHGARRARARRSAGRPRAAARAARRRPTRGDVTATAGPSSSSSGSEPPPARPAAAHDADARRRRARRRRSRRAARSARASSSARGAASICSTGIVARRALGIAVQAQRRLQRGERELVDPHRARQRVCAHARDRRLASPRRCPACGPPSSLSAEKHTTSAPRRDALARGRLVGEHVASASSRCEQTPDPRSSISSSRACRASSAERPAARTSSVKPTVRKFDACTRISAAVSGPIARS